MKTAVSIPDPVFQQGERLARKQKKTRSQLYADALAEYVARREPDAVTTAIDQALAEIDQAEDRAFVRRAARLTAERLAW